jgi:hypothetical protein
MPTLADRRADRLLRRHLNLNQRRQLTRFNRFTEQAASGVEYTFHLPPGARFLAIDSINEDYFNENYCIGVTDGYEMPQADQALALLLFLRADENTFREIADSTATWPW